MLTFGLGNPVVAGAELVGSTTVAVLAAAVPVLALVLVVAFVVWMWSLWRRRAPAGAPPAPTGWGSPS
jgi:uncharacterized membrane protein YoaK (UPF0700 family)